MQADADPCGPLRRTRQTVGMSHPPVPDASDLLNRVRALVPLWEDQPEANTPFGRAVGRLVQDMKDYDAERTITGELALFVQPVVWLVWDGDDIVSAHRTEDEADLARERLIHLKSAYEPAERLQRTVGIENVRFED